MVCMHLHTLCIRFVVLAIPVLCNSATKFRILATEKYILQFGESQAGSKKTKHFNLCKNW